MDKDREQFEAWYLAEYCEFDKDCGLEWLSTEPCGSYRYERPATQFKVWQASRESLVIELPAIRAEDYCPLSNVAYREECRASIEAAGLKVQP